MNQEIGNIEYQDLKKFLDSIDFSGTSGNETLLEETSTGLFESPSQMLRSELEKEVEKGRKWLQKNYPPKPPKPKQPRQLKEDPDSGTFT